MCILLRLLKFSAVRSERGSVEVSSLHPHVSTSTSTHEAVEIIGVVCE